MKSGAKRGDQRRSLAVPTGFAPVLRWVVALHPSDCRRLARTLDAATLGPHVTVLPIHGLMRGCAIPVAGHIVRATAKGAWPPQWDALVHPRHGSVPGDGTVILAADRVW